MCQKYRVAVAVAMLKSKPKELTVNQYMDKLKDKLNEKMDIDVISINSDDFNFDEEVFNEFNENDISTNENNDSASILRDVEVHKTNETCDVERPEISTVFATLAYKHQQVIIILYFLYAPTAKHESILQDLSLTFFNALINLH